MPSSTTHPPEDTQHVVHWLRPATASPYDRAATKTSTGHTVNRKDANGSFRVVNRPPLEPIGRYRQVIQTRGGGEASARALPAPVNEQIGDNAQVAAPRVSPRLKRAQMAWFPLEGVLRPFAPVVSERSIRQARSKRQCRAVRTISPEEDDISSVCGSSICGALPANTTPRRRGHSEPEEPRTCLGCQVDFDRYCPDWSAI